MTKLSVNINKIATLRNSRGGNLPNLLQCALDIEKWGAHGITVHPRPDERHIRKSDVYELKKHVTTEFNIEGYPSDDWISLVQEIRPTQCTLVPDPPHALTSNAGFVVEHHVYLLSHAIEKLRQIETRISLFIDPFDYLDKDILPIVQTGVDRVELYTESYAKAFGTSKEEDVLSVYQRVGQKLHEAGLGINAGHDLNLQNLSKFIQALPFVSEVSIGHALICDALYVGLEQSVKGYLAVLGS